MWRHGGRHRSLAGSPTGSRSRAVPASPRAADPAHRHRGHRKERIGRIPAPRADHFCLAKHRGQPAGRAARRGGPLGGSPTPSTGRRIASPDRGRSREDPRGAPGRRRAGRWCTNREARLRATRVRPRSANPRAGPRRRPPSRPLLNDRPPAAEAVREPDVIPDKVRGEPWWCARRRWTIRSSSASSGPWKALLRDIGADPYHPLRGAFDTGCRELRRPPAARPDVIAKRER